MSWVQGLSNNLSIKQAQLWDIQDLSRWAAPLKIPSLLFQRHQLLVPPGEPALSCGVCLNLLGRSWLFPCSRLCDIQEKPTTYETDFIRIIDPNMKTRAANFLWQLNGAWQDFNVVRVVLPNAITEDDTCYWLKSCTFLDFNYFTNDSILETNEMMGASWELWFHLLTFPHFFFISFFNTRYAT